MIDERLARLAESAGIEREYWDALGTRHELGDATARAILAALGADDGVGRDADGGAGRGPPPRCFVPPGLEAGARVWGIAVQLWALRSARNWGIGDFTDLAALAGIAAQAGASLVGINPLHARHLACPDAASPYSPSSRRFLDPMAIDVEAVPEWRESEEARRKVESSDFRRRIDAARAAPHVDYAGVSALKLEALRAMFASFERIHAARADPRGDAFQAFVARHGEALMRFAEFEALRLIRAREGLPVDDWRTWPEAWRDPDSIALGDFRREHGEDIRFVLWLQWEAERQLDAAAASAERAGLALRFYRDLAVGASRSSAETWGDQRLIARGISIGAPPDAFSATGQDWGLPPWNPRVLAARDYEPFAQLIAANMRGAGALRIDHVMALTRLFWIPDGMEGRDGAYVRQPFEELAHVIAHESERQRCVVIGEDLGSVPEGLRERLAERRFLSYRVLLFERHWSDGGRFKRPHEYPRQSLATAVTHDLPPIAEYWRFGDIHRRRVLGLIGDDRARDEEVARRHEERWRLMALMSEEAVLPADPENTDDIAAALHRLVARTPAAIAMVQLDDVLGESEPVNIPGTDREYPNWRRKLSLPLEDLARDPRVQRLAEAMRAEGRVSLSDGRG